MTNDEKVRPVLRRPAVAIGAAFLLIPALSACGSSSSDDSDTTSRPSTGASASASSGLKAVSISGDVGKSLKATWHSALKAGATPTVTTLVKGDGDTIATGDTVSTYLYIGDATSKKDAYSDYDQGAPESVPYTSKLSGLFSQILDGATYGSRVVAVTPASELFGTSGNSSLGIGADDSLVIVADLVEKAATSPTPTDDAVHDVAPSKEPAVVSKNGVPTGLDWSGISKPDLATPVQRVILKQGTGAAVAATDTVTVNYLGETYDAKSAFDESYTSQPLTSALSGLIRGWSIGLTGVKVGSRVLLEIPPAYGYGASGSGSSIPGNATLYFVIDVVKATAGS